MNGEKKTKDTGEKRYVPVLKERYRIFELLREHVSLVPDSELVQYEHGWDDERVAKEVGGRIARSHVARARRETMGDLVPHPGQGKGTAGVTLSRLLAAHNALCDKLGEPDLKV